MAKMMSVIRFMTPRGACEHCGGIIREYRGSVSCMMCGRESGHSCPECLKPARSVKKSYIRSA